MASPATRSTNCPGCGRPRDAELGCPACALEQALLGVEAFASSHGGGGARAPSGFGALAGPTSGTTFGGYVLRREIAAGGMGVVFEAEKPGLNRPVALKLIRAAAFANATDLARFRNEAEAAAHLDHPHIVPIYDIGEDRGQPFFTMKLIAGGSLAGRLEQGPLPAHEAAVLMAKVARAVHHAHERGVLHRDLKPANILLDPADEPWLTDFGLAKLAGASHGVTLTETHLGTPQYMSPEQAAGRARDLTTASDVWSLGAIFYQMLSGRVPFDGASPGEIYRRIAEEEPLPLGASQRLPRGSNPGAHAPQGWRRSDRDLETLALRCLEKDPARRLPSAGFLAAELARWLAGEPIRSRPVTRTERLAKWARRRPGMAVLSALALALAGAGAAGVLVQWRRAETNAASARLHAAQAVVHQRNAEENAYFATLAHALAARQQHDFGRARALLGGLDPARRGFEWRLLHWLSRGDELALARFEGAMPHAIAWMPGRERLAVLTDAGRLEFPDFGAPSGPQPAGALELRASGASSSAVVIHRALNFSPEGRYLAYSAGNTLLVRRAQDGALLHRSSSLRPGSAWLDEHRLLFGLSLFQRATRQAAHVLNLQDGSTNALPAGLGAPLAASAGRGVVALSYYEAGGDLVKVWPAARFPEGAPSAEIRFGLPGYQPALVALSPEGEFVAVAWGSTSIGARELTVHRTAGGARVLQQQLRFSLNALAFHPSEPLLAVVSEDATVRTYRFLQPVPELSTYDDGAHSHGQPMGGEGVGAAGPQDPPRQMLTRSAQAGRAGFLLGHEQRVRDVAFTADGRALATVSDDGSARLWPLRARVPDTRAERIETATYAFQPAASRDGRRVLMRLNDQHCWLWDRSTGARTDLGLNHHPVAVFSDDRALTHDADAGDMVMWRIGDGGARELWRAGGAARGWSRLGVLSRDERIAISVQAGRVVRVDCAERAVTASPRIATAFGDNAVTCHDLSPNGQWVAATAFGHRTRVFAVEALATNGSPFGLGGARDFDTALVFHPDGTRLFVGNEDGFVRVFATATWRELPAEKFRAQRGAVTAMAMSSNGEVLATSGDETMKFWDGRSPASEKPSPRRERLSLRVSWPRNWMRFAAGDTVLLHSAENRPLEAWEAPR